MSHRGHCRTEAGLRDEGPEKVCSGRVGPDEETDVERPRSSPTMDGTATLQAAPDAPAETTYAGILFVEVALGERDLAYDARSEGRGALRTRQHHRAWGGDPAPHASWVRAALDTHHRAVRFERDLTAQARLHG